MLVKCWNVEDSQKIMSMSFCNIFFNTDTKFTCQTCVGWGTVVSPTFTKINKSFDFKRTSEKSFGSLIWFLSRKLKLLLYSLLDVFCKIDHYYILHLFILLVLFTSWKTYWQTLAKCCFVTTLPLSKQHHFWPVDKKIYKISETCCMLCIVLVSYPMLQHTTLRPTQQKKRLL